MQGQTINWEKVCACDIAFDKGLRSRIYKELLKVNDEKASQLKVEKDLNRYFIKEYKWLLSARKSDQHY